MAVIMNNESWYEADRVHLAETCIFPKAGALVLNEG